MDNEDLKSENVLAYSFISGNRFCLLDTLPSPYSPGFAKAPLWVNYWADFSRPLDDRLFRRNQPLTC